MTRASSDGLYPIVGESIALRQALALVDRYAPTRLHILLLGATGTGKELLARRIHQMSGRAGGFVPVNCGALPRDLAESLLFGHERGAFSGALRRHRGHLVCADGGTLFLDELSSLTAEAQVKLLRALDSGEIQVLGDERRREVDVRVVAALQGEIVEQVTSRALRADLYHRLAGVVIRLPALAQRVEDIVPLARHFAALDGRVLEPGVEPVLLRHSWPGNVRELRLAIERAGALVTDGTLSRAAVEDAMTLAADTGVTQGCPSSNVFDGGSADTVLLTVCERNGWHAGRAAAALGVSRTTLYYRLVALGVSLRDRKKMSWVAPKAVRPIARIVQTTGEQLNSTPTAP